MASDQTIVLCPKQRGSIPEEYRTAVADAVDKLNQPTCVTGEGMGEESCRAAWKTLLGWAPDPGFPSLVRRIAQSSATDRKPLVDLFAQNDAHFFLYLSGPYAEPYPVEPQAVMGAITAYAQRPDADPDLLRSGLKGMVQPFVASGGCFTSIDYDFPRHSVPFLYADMRQMRRGWEYMPFIEGSLTNGNCTDQQVTQILEDLAHIGPRNTAQLMEWVATHRWNDSPEFARSFLELAGMIPFKEPLREPARKAIISLIPKEGSPSKEDVRLIDKGLGWIFTDLPRPKHRALTESIAKERPHFRDALLKMGGF